MEFPRKLPEDIRSSNGGNKISEGFLQLNIHNSSYHLDDFWADLFVFVKDNTEILSLIGSFKKDHRDIYKLRNDNGTKIFDALVKLDERMPFALDNIIAEILLFKGIEDGRNNLNRYADRSQTTAGMFDQSLVDKSELMFL